jgi:uncharacterized protein (DUF1778 family)
MEIKIKKNTKKLTIEFPADEYVFLKMACEHQGISMKEFVTKSIIKSVEEYEDIIDKQNIESALADIIENSAVDWDDLKKELNIGE